VTLAASPSTPTSACDFATIDCANIVVTFEAVAPPRAGAGEVAVMTFLPAAGSVAASGHTNEIGLRVGKADFTNLDETDDYSYSGGGAALVDDAHITLYRNGRLIWGAEPPL
jgi:cellulose 1,4-beta-cellobiosidase